ncbi:MAG TPA: LysR family transcriptional regulator, partial [Polyangiaceae bacterium]|nr:LysR family transcriptional regulator [Polyangiaceae bacterium]
MDRLSQIRDKVVLDDIEVFVRVVQAGSIRGAAELLGMPKSTVSRKLAALEERLQARLLQRTTRTLSLTNIGRIYYDHCLRIVGDVEEAERAVRDQQASPRGLLRVSAPTNSSFLGPIVSDYLKQYPDVRIELDCTARIADLIEERFDLGIRAGSLPDSTLIARGLCSIPWILVAAPAYLRKRGRPRSPDDLQSHDCLLFGPGAPLRLRSTKDAKKAKEVAAPLRLLVTDMDVLHAAVSDGLGIALMPAFRCAVDLQARKLERVLPGWDGPSTPIHVVYPSTRHVSLTVKS